MYTTYSDILKIYGLNVFKIFLIRVVFLLFFYDDETVKETWTKTVVKQRLQDQFIQKWSSNIFQSPKDTLYMNF